MNEQIIINLSIEQMLLAYLLVIIIIFLIKDRSLKKELSISIVRMSTQLLIIGFVLIILFEQLPNYISLLYLGVMLFFATRTMKRRTKVLRKSAIYAMIIGSLSALFYFLIFIVQPGITQILNPRYMIPIYGMLLGNTLTTLVLFAAPKFKVSPPVAKRVSKAALEIV